MGPCHSPRAERSPCDAVSRRSMQQIVLRNAVTTQSAAGSKNTQQQSPQGTAASGPKSPPAGPPCGFGRATRPRGREPTFCRPSPSLLFIPAPVKSMCPSLRDEHTYVLSHNASACSVPLLSVLCLNLRSGQFGGDTATHGVSYSDVLEPSTFLSKS